MCVIACVCLSVLFICLCNSWASDKLDVFGDLVGLSALDLPNDDYDENTEASSTTCRDSSLNSNSLAVPMSASRNSFSSFIFESQGISVVNTHDQCPQGDQVTGKLQLSSQESLTVYSRLNNSSPLTCGPPVGSTRYDTLAALQQRDKYPVLRELEVAVIFKKANSNIINLAAVETELKEVLARVSSAAITAR